MMVVQLFVVGMFFPETKQVALEDMRRKNQSELTPMTDWQTLTARVIPATRSPRD